MQTEYLYPEIGDRRTANDWQDGGRETVYELAHSRVKNMLSSHYPEYIPAVVDAKIREKFPIKLDAKDMEPGNGRWED
jgi:trimethylamine--corrinoid protein Co-methyltransferase